MASIESKQIRATFSKNAGELALSMEQQRQAWENAVAAVNQALDVTITPVDVDGIGGEWITDGAEPSDAAVLFLHGGGYSAGSCRTHRALAARLLRASGVPVLLIDYRLAPEHPFPAAVEDATTAYHWLLRRGFDSQRLVLGGDSAGGGLAAAALLKLRDSGVALPAGAFLLSPWLDLTLSGPTMHSNAQRDPMSTMEVLHAAAQRYMPTGDPRDPLASPLFADLHGLPPLLIQAGEHELLLSDATRFAERAEEAGTPVTLEVWDEMWHVWHAWPELPEAQQAIERIARFIDQRLTTALKPVVR